MTEPRSYDDANLRRLSETDDFEVAENEPDIRGWDVMLSDGTTVGEVDDLVVDTTSMKARYIDVELDKKAMSLEDSRHVLVPIERADLDTDQKHVHVYGIDRQGILQQGMGGSSQPAGTSHAGAGASQSGAGTSQMGTGTTQSRGWEEKTPRPARADNMRLTRSAEELKIGKRMVQAGEVRVGKHVETERVTETVGREREKVTIERRPASPGASTSPQFGEDEIIVPVMEEEIIVEKRPVVKEELVIAKERVTEQQEVAAELRHEEFDIKGAGDEQISGRERVTKQPRKGDM